jgi:rhodanese-related sulfurtransferase
MDKKTFWKLPFNYVLVIGLSTVLAACSPPQATLDTDPPISTSAAQTSEASIPLPRPQEIGVDEAAGLWEAGAFVLDVRQPEEWEQVHIPDTTLIPLGELQARLDEVPDDRPIVVVCRSGNRSLSGASILLEAGYDPAGVASMAGGVTEWEAEGHPVVR